MGQEENYIPETPKFVTKRKCLISVSVISFLSLLAGFILGRLISDQIIVMKDKKLLRQLDSNGIAQTLKTRDELMKQLNAHSYHEAVEMIPDVKHLRKLDVQRNEDLFKDLSLFKLNVEEIKNITTVATICGTQEQDRYIVLSASEEGYDVAYKIAKTFDELYRSQLLWEPKRSIIFCVFLGKEDTCMKTILDRIKPKIVAYIAIHGKAARGHQKIAVSGSGMVQATVLDAIDEVKLFNGYELSLVNTPIALHRLNIDVPHVVLTFVDENRTDHYTSENQKILAQIAGITLFRLSEQVFFKWNPKYFRDVMNKTLSEVATIEEVKETNRNLTLSVNSLIEGIEKFNSALDNVNMLRLLDVRMMNDKLVDLDRALLCPDPYSRSKTDFAIFYELFSTPPKNIIMHLNNIRDCYDEAHRIIVDQAQCRQLVVND